MDLNRYILHVRPDVIREIGKRGVKELKKDEFGVVKKRMNKIPSSFGWGTVDDTVPVNKKELKDIKRTLDSIIGQIGRGNALSPLEVPSKAASGKRPPPIDVDSLSKETLQQKKVCVPTILEEWHAYCAENYGIGALGVIPDCYHSNGMPPIEDMVHTNVGQVLMNFAKFVKAIF